MIDKTLAHMIDETLQGCPKLSGFGSMKMLEVRMNQAHLMGSLICIRACFNLP
jgi:hypothetical protein